MEEIYMAWIEAHTIEDERGVWIGPYPGETREYLDKVWELAMGPGGAVDSMIP